MEIKGRFSQTPPDVTPEAAARLEAQQRRQAKPSPPWHHGCYATRLGKPARRVTNLGWFMRAMSEAPVVRIQVNSPDALGFAGCSDKAIVEIWFDAYRIGMPLRFECGFASALVCAEWISTRRNLRGVPVYWFGRPKPVMAEKLQRELRSYR